MAKTIEIVGKIVRTNWNKERDKESYITVQDEKGEEHEVKVNTTSFMPIVNRAGFSLATLNHPTRLSEEGKNVRHGPHGDHVKFKSTRQRNLKILAAIRSYDKPTRFEVEREDGELVLKSSTVRDVPAEA